MDSGRRRFLGRCGVVVTGAAAPFVQGNQGWADTTLCTTREPCSMCMSAMAWANLRRVVWASSIDDIRGTGIIQIDLTARLVADVASSFCTPQLLLGGVLANHTSRLFREARRLRENLPDAPGVTYG
ncbi:hypothetical protein [Streptomyces sp. bgisy034]|uniref:hypothetical protein n=1 Tax=Streptomyces sp. bgisy034 TaxID=3413774 RepID=UPI003EC095DF